MNILVLDSSFDKMQVANYHFANDQQYRLLSAYSAEKGAQGEKALDLIQSLSYDTTNPQIFSEYQYLLFNRGPGSFVGTRISTSLAQGIATVNPEINVIAVSSLEMLAAQIQFLGELANKAQAKENPFTNKTKIFVAIDANMGESYVAAFNYPELTLVGTEQLIKNTELETIYQCLTSEDTQVKAEMIATNNYTHKFGFEVKDQVILVGNAWNKHYPAELTLNQLLNNEVFAREIYPEISQYFCDHLLVPQMVDGQRVGVNEDVMEDIFAFFEQITALPDVRFFSALILRKIAQQEFTPRLNIEPIYIRDKVTY
ncbi:tRNA (adenosine(37)-N6)-threonylcarbamoyltransferase complex dimerization subunit type 1 TsaB [Psittacicella hinzii]|uniref:tRNA (Adenosine(37)-N6)-threonylcarbamoyltransferase complex dimerization subunit type 1 TsaB n=1 Tax=Psittacicella hinzii TaxID=2028575 RepID=A0A3A1Y7K3_9GAMM|nr:tRNA (adenosine(37)-N6)-threonylcarbamoyltransferase complex dimerization subunit type 1 TsaB [Psittacicella hinzii]RIY33240.1 tRNA (adenosine(37)-N6)-threonylcarbamoyltransferase complex dimerization subunit type 1 TsaB [Psittacicella hinzii]